MNILARMFLRIRGVVGWALVLFFLLPSAVLAQEEANENAIKVFQGLGFEGVTWGASEQEVLEQLGKPTCHFSYPSGEEICRYPMSGGVKLFYQKHRFGHWGVLELQLGDEDGFRYGEMGYAFSSEIDCNRLFTDIVAAEESKLGPPTSATTVPGDLPYCGGVRNTGENAAEFVWRSDLGTQRIHVRGAVVLIEAFPTGGGRISGVGGW